MYASKKLKEKVTSAPLEPGVYIYRDRGHRVIYVGKAVNLRSRTRSYFQNYDRLEANYRMLVDKIRDVEYLTTDSEVDALLLEANLIKKYSPKFNRALKDDKSYAWVKFTTNTDFPKIELVREKKGSGEYFGPYPNTQSIKRILKRVRNVFPVRSCNRRISEEFINGKRVIKSSDPKPCLYYFLGQCNAPCAGKVTKAEYRKTVNDLKKFFRGQRNEVIKDLQDRMSEFSKDREFEKAAILRDRVNDIAYVTQQIRIEKDMDEGMLKVAKDELRSKSLDDLLSRLKLEGLAYKNNFKIEGYDISNIQGTNATGSMVVMVDGKSTKSFYRKFKIKTKETPDDFEMMREVFSRRFVRKGKKSDESLDIFPDLVVVDGGKGQLSAAYHILQKLNPGIPIIGLAKRKEEVFKIVENNGELDFKKVTINARSNASYLLQNLRDEAHRFALGYHRKLRSKAMIKSKLDDIPGIGEITKKRLLKAFGSSENIKRASVQELLGIVKNKNTVEKIKKLL